MPKPELVPSPTPADPKLIGDWPAFPMHYGTEHKSHTGMSARDIACIKLRVPRSTKGWLNALIREARTADLAERLFVDPDTSTPSAMEQARELTDTQFPRQ